MSSSVTPCLRALAAMSTLSGWLSIVLLPANTDNQVGRGRRPTDSADGSGESARSRTRCQPQVAPEQQHPGRMPQGIRGSGESQTTVPRCPVDFNRLLDGCEPKCQLRYQSAQSQSEVPSQRVLMKFGPFCGGWDGGGKVLEEPRPSTSSSPSQPDSGCGSVSVGGGGDDASIRWLVSLPRTESGVPHPRRLRGAGWCRRRLPSGSPY